MIRRQIKDGHFAFKFPEPVLLFPFQIAGREPRILPGRIILILVSDFGKLASRIEDRKFTFQNIHRLTVGNNVVHIDKKDVSLSFECYEFRA